MSRLKELLEEYRNNPPRMDVTLPNHATLTKERLVSLLKEGKCSILDFKMKDGTLNQVFVVEVDEHNCEVYTDLQYINRLISTQKSGNTVFSEYKNIYSPYSTEISKGRLGFVLDTDEGRRILDAGTGTIY